MQKLRISTNLDDLIDQIETESRELGLRMSGREVDMGGALRRVLDFIELQEDGTYNYEQPPKGEFEGYGIPQNHLGAVLLRTSISTAWWAVQDQHIKFALEWAEKIQKRWAEIKGVPIEEAPEFPSYLQTHIDAVTNNGTEIDLPPADELLEKHDIPKPLAYFIRWCFVFGIATEWQYPSTPREGVDV